MPQFVLEEAEAKGTGVKIVVAQPRRIAAMGVAQRVAEERGQPMGQSVGYMIRGETKVTRHPQPHHTSRVRVTLTLT